MVSACMQYKAVCLKCSAPCSEMIPHSKLVEWFIETSLLIVLVVLTVVIVDIIRWHLRNRIENKGYPLPPGPARLSVVGSILIVNPLEPWLTTSKWQAKYGAPRMVTWSDIYGGYYIPKGAVVVLNVWYTFYPTTTVVVGAMSSDEARYPDGDKFMPERFLNAQGLLIDDDPSHFLFGFGRRKCPWSFPGRHFCGCHPFGSPLRRCWSTLDFNLAKDADGNDITFKPAFKGWVTKQPYPFPCRLTPRAHVDEEMLNRVLNN
ncbi:hypothetical protein OG21DRAFT_1606503 [Imleria badia]|nr:hypothetical protein OG21DRAFT_1606503 [Imleria badia]